MTSRKLLQQTFGLTLVVLLLTGCGGAPAEPTATPTPAPPTATPTPTATTGQVRGILVYEDTQKPVVAKNLHLVIAEVTASAVTLNYTPGDPRTETDDSGTFVFENVPPGTYCLTAEYFPLDNDAGRSIIVEVTAGQVVDLGTISVKK